MSLSEELGTLQCTVVVNVKAIHLLQVGISAVKRERVCVQLFNLAVWQKLSYFCSCEESSRLVLELSCFDLFFFVLDNILDIGVA